ncbi:tetraspanin 37 isoform X2 [Mugil cephalus]|uniref:tetraspanin 37 isoform X2 n=1 Tax=Mugil cephalus TaxID=48193 RepID=UPI001FB8558A|nr:tetraspanin 37 isoform X2 [Mugil cephalus]
MSHQRRRAVLHFMCQLLSVLGFGVALSGIYMLMTFRQNSHLVSQADISLPATLAFISAGLLLFTGFLGSWLSHKDSSCLQGVFVYMLVVVFCVESTASALAYYHSTKVDSEMGTISGIFQNYTGSSQDSMSRAVDATQEELQCCGVHGYTDWLETSWFIRTGRLAFPQSCCNTTFTSCNGTVEQPWQLYTQGCQVKLRKAIQFVLSLLIFGTPVVFLVELCVFIDRG